MLKKWISCLLLFASFVGCSKPLVKLKPNSFQNFSVENIGAGKTAMTGVVFSQSESNKKLELISEEIFQDELKNSGFIVIENSRFNHLVNRYNRVKNGFALSGELPEADYIIISTLTRFEKYGSGDFYLFYGNITEVCDVKVDVTIIDTKTAKTYTASGDGRSALKDLKVLFINNPEEMGTKMFEDAYRVAVRKAIQKTRI